MATIPGAETNAPSGGLFDCISAFTPLFGLGGGICADQNGKMYLQLGVGTPGASFNAGYTNDFNSFLTGPSVSAQGLGAFGGANTSSAAGGYAIGSPGASATYGWQLN